jgi:ADP-ribosyl-[dinitrogen reductase] hydrolase
MAVVLAGFLHGLPKWFVLDKNWEKTKNLELHEEIRAIADGNFLTEQAHGDFNVVSSLHSALWAFATGDSFEDIVLKAVNLGNDADTTAAIAGQFAGAFYGYNAIPERFIEGLAGKDMIEHYLDKIL